MHLYFQSRKIYNKYFNKEFLLSSKSNMCKVEQIGLLTQWFFFIPAKY